MAKKRSATPTVDWRVQRFAGKSFVLAGKLLKRDLTRATELLKGDGGKVVSGVTAALDYLVLGSGRQAAQLHKEAEELNQAGTASIQILTLDEFFALFTPDRALALALLQAGSRGHNRWRMLTDWGKFRVDLSGSDLRGLKLDRIWLRNVNLDGADLRQADLTYTSLYGSLTGVRFDDAQLGHCTFERLIDCKLVDASLQEAMFFKAVLERTDFTGANLEEAHLSRVATAGVIFQRANLKRAYVASAKLTGANLVEADLTRANLEASDLAGANLTRANLTEADLFQANLQGADLSNACFRSAILADADLSNARIDGADFEGANLIGAKLDGLDLSRARGLVGLKPPPKAGKHLRELDRVARQATRLKVTASLALADGASIPVTVLSESNGQNVFLESPKVRSSSPSGARTLSAGMLAVVRPWLHGTLRLDSIKVTATAAPLKPKALRQLVLAAWCEACGRDVPVTEQIKEAVVEDQHQQQHRFAGILEDLCGGADGIKRWNARTNEQRQHAGPFRKIDLSGARLDGANLSWQLDFRGANLSGASLVGAQLGHWSKFNRVCFRGADLTGADTGCGRFRGASFEKALLRQSKLRVTEFLDVCFRGADLTDADLYYSNLRGADLSGATLTGANLERVKFDERTRWPAGFVLPEGMFWQGTGPDPRRQTRKRPQPAEVTDLGTFLDRLRQTIDPSRLANALEMLRSDRFQLFNQAEEGSLTGIVRSQSNADLVYACRLASDGSFSCCTQNLNACGGLRGALCKHLLVLIVGLARASQIELASVQQWVQSSGSKRPKVDKDNASAIFLKYKGAEAGEIDWRPTETIPEDFYAF